MQSVLRRLLLVCCGAMILATLAVVAVGWQLSRPVPARIGTSPAALAAEAVTFPSESGSVIRGWLSSANSSRGAVLLLPPVRTNRLAMVPRAKFLLQADYSTLLIDLQGTGESSGDAITFGWRERFDVLAAVRFLNERRAGEPIGIIAASLGGAAALLATPPLEVDAVVLEAVYPSFDIAVENRLRMRMGAVGSVFTPLLLWQLKPRLGVWPSQLRPVDHIRLLRCPVFVIGGVEDRHTTAADTRLLFEAAPEPKQLWLIPRVAHVDFFDAAPDEYRQRVLQFLAASFAAGGRGDETTHAGSAAGQKQP